MHWSWATYLPPESICLPLLLFSPLLCSEVQHIHGATKKKKKKIRSFYYILQPDPPYSMGYFFMLPKTFIFITPPPPKLRYKSIQSFKKSDLSCPNNITVKLDESETVVKHRRKGERKAWKHRKILFKVAFQIYALAQHEIMQKWTSYIMHYGCVYTKKLSGSPN